MLFICVEVKIETLKAVMLEDLRLVIKALVPFDQQLFAVCIDESSTDVKYIGQFLRPYALSAQQFAAENPVL
jgi:hypothetical protein